MIWFDPIISHTSWLFMNFLYFKLWKFQNWTTTDSIHQECAEQIFSEAWRRGGFSTGNPSRMLIEGLDEFLGWWFQIWVFPKIVGKHPQIIHFNRVFHYFHHPFWGTTILGNTQICFILFYVHPYLGKWSNLTHIWQIGLKPQTRFAFDVVSWFTHTKTNVAPEIGWLEDHRFLFGMASWQVRAC